MLMDPGAVRIESSAVSDKIIFQHIRLGDQVDDVKSESPHSLFLPETDDIFEFFPYSRVLPVEVRLGYIEKMQIIFSQGRDIFPCISTELGYPVGGSVSVDRIPENIVIHILGITSQCFLEPLVIRGGMVENHIKHQADPVLVRFPDQSFGVFHSPEHRVYAEVVRDVVAVVVHRRLEERGDPNVINSQRLKIIQLGTDSVQVSDPVSVRVAVRLNINLIHRAVSKTAHSYLPIESPCRSPEGDPQDRYNSLPVRYGCAQPIVPIVVVPAFTSIPFLKVSFSNPLSSVMTIMVTSG